MGTHLVSSPPPPAAAQGLPFAIAGVGDLLALFRCVSCRYRFSTDVTRPGLMGAIGRVYSSCEVCVSVCVLTCVLTCTCVYDSLCEACRTTAAARAAAAGIDFSGNNSGIEGLWYLSGYSGRLRQVLGVWSRKIVGIPTSP